MCHYRIPSIRQVHSRLSAYRSNRGNMVNVMQVIQILEIPPRPGGVGFPLTGSNKLDAPLYQHSSTVTEKVCLNVLGMYMYNSNDVTWYRDIYSWGWPMRPVYHPRYYGQQWDNPCSHAQQFHCSFRRGVGMVKLVFEVQ